SLDGLFKQLGWPYVRVENTQVEQIIRDLDRFDIFCGMNLYNYDNAQPFEAYRDAWVRFLERGGIIIGLDANYGQQIVWLTQLGDGLELSAERCEIGCKEGTTSRRVSVVAPDDPFAPLSGVGLPWGHVRAYGRGWKVLATCPDGSALCLKAQVGKGGLVATNFHTECGYPSAEYLARLWSAHCPTIMDAGLQVSIDQGHKGVGINRLAVDVGAAAEVSGVLCQVRRQGGEWESQQVALSPTADGAAKASMAYPAGPGTTHVRVALLRGTQPCWWTSFECANADLPALGQQVTQRLDEAGENLAALPAGSYLRRRAEELRLAVAGALAEAELLGGRDAGAETQARWDALARDLSRAGEEATAVAGRAEVAARVAAGRPKTLPPFTVVRSHPLAKIFRDSAPDGPLSGGIDVSAAADEGESVQVAVVPLGPDLSHVSVAVEPFRGERGEVIGGGAVELYRVCYVHVAGPSAGVPPGISWWPDPLLPAEQPFAVRHVCQPLWLDIFVPRSARPGLYRGAIVVKAAGHAERVPINLRVWPFALPAEHSLRQAFVFRAYLVGQKYFGGGGDDYLTKVPVDVFLRMADVCLKRRLGLALFGNEISLEPRAVVPYLREKKTAGGWTFDFTEADRVWEHVFRAGSRTLLVGFSPTWMCSQGGGDEYFSFLEAYGRAVQAHFARKGWLDYAVFYMPDEPWSEESVAACQRVASVLDRAAPRIKRLMTAPRDPRLDGLAHIWVPGGLPDAHPEDEVCRRLLSVWQKPEIEQWWYICCGPVHPYPNFFVDYPAIDCRMVFWLTWKYGKTGFLYWGVEYHGDPREMTADGPTEKYSVGPPHMGNGDGTLCYWGPNFEFYPSIRLNAIRDGIEDYEYFALLRRLADEAERKGQARAAVVQARGLLAVDERVLRLTEGSPNFEYTTDPETLLSARRALAKAIIELGR
ncbi:MAG: DUF4091 domain-containing protein, partial [Armatimonadetes bacterium]|nr:DUF4091 domain-containing protein [Armatimonadota bacterium]